MKKFFFFAAVLSAFFLISCHNDADWHKVTILAGQEIIFSAPDVNSEDKSIIIAVDNTDTVLISNRNLVHKICYLRTAFPSKSIIIDYVRTKEDDKIVYSPRFINLEK
ncbi:MAG: hypothetical protein ACOYMB_04290 [Patescibacteria group bacterium]